MEQFVCEPRLVSAFAQQRHGQGEQGGGDRAFARRQAPRQLVRPCVRRAVRRCSKAVFKVAHGAVCVSALPHVHGAPFAQARLVHISHTPAALAGGKKPAGLLIVANAAHGTPLALLLLLGVHLGNLRGIGNPRSGILHEPSPEPCRKPE